MIGCRFVLTSHWLVWMYVAVLVSWVIPRGLTWLSLVPRRCSSLLRIRMCYVRSASWSNISITKDCVWTHFQTLRRELKIRRDTEYFWRVWIVLRIHIVVSRTSSVFSALKFTHHWFSTACTQLLVLKYERVKFDFSGFHTNTWNCEMKRVINIFLLLQQFGVFCCLLAHARGTFA